MAKAINWPLQFRDEILKEDCETLRCAFRLGALYYENQYWVDQEIVDIRVNHLKLRKGIVVGSVQQKPLSALGPDELTPQKITLQNKEAVKQFLEATYGQSVEDETPITIVYYKNLPIIPEEIEEPDDVRPEQ
jgi:hypothetical protein